MRPCETDIVDYCNNCINFFRVVTQYFKELLKGYPFGIPYTELCKGACFNLMKQSLAVSAQCFCAVKKNS